MALVPLAELVLLGAPRTQKTSRVAPTEGTVVKDYSVKAPTARIWRCLDRVPFHRLRVRPPEQWRSAGAAAFQPERSGSRAREDSYPTRPGGAGAARGRVVVHTTRKTNDKRRSAAGRRLDVDVATMRQHDLTNDVETEAQPA